MANDFAVQIMEALDQYNLQVSKTMQTVLPEVAKEAAKMTRSVSPSRSGDYASGWRQKITKNALGTVEAVVYNAKKAGVAHLLEKGHLKRNGRRSNPIEHIKSVEEWVQTAAVQKLEEALR